MKKKQICLSEVLLPDFGMPTVEPRITPQEYECRMSAVLHLLQDERMDFLLVYGDREHFANICYLTGFDPRFEESLLVLSKDGARFLLVGNECLSYSEISPVKLDRILYQSFSLLDQPREASNSLETILRTCGVGRGHRVGIAGWKYFDQRDAGAPKHWIEAPAFVVDTVREIVAEPWNVVNATAVFMHANTGLRATSSVDQLAVFEFAACHTSDAVRRVLFGVRPGMTECEAAQLMQLNGLPLSMHVVLATGPRAYEGLSSPSFERIERGTPLLIGVGIRGAANARAGYVAESAQELSDAAGDYVDSVVGPYFGAVAEWYEHLQIGCPAGDLWRIMDSHTADGIGLALNPGHLIHLEEWLASPFFEGSAYPIKSGMTIQTDFIPVPGGSYFTTNIEDTVALADEALQQQFGEKYPDAWARIQKRREFMIHALGIRLPGEVLPFSNIPAYLPPFLLDSRRVMCCR
jgi:Creatinase/Prolidase N-terminal domain